MIYLLTTNSDCRCLHGGKLQFPIMGNRPTINSNEILTKSSFEQASIVGCPNPPLAGGPCSLVMPIIADPASKNLAINSEQVVTQSVVAVSDKQVKIMVQDSGNPFTGIESVVGNADEILQAKLAETLIEKQRHKQDDQESRTILNAFLEIDCKPEFLRGEKIVLFSASDKGSSFTRKISLVDKGEHVVHKNDKVKVLFKDIPARKEYSCFLELGFTSRGKIAGGHLLFSNLYLNDQYHVENLDESGYPMNVLRRDLRFDLRNAPGGEEFLGYCLEEMFIRIKTWHIDHNSEYQSEEYYGLLIDVEDGEGRLARDSESKPEKKDLLKDKKKELLKKLLLDENLVWNNKAKQERIKAKEKEKLWKRFGARGRPFCNSYWGRHWSNMHILLIPTKKQFTDPDATPEQIREEQIELIKVYIRQMRKEWKKLWEHVQNLGGDWKAEFDDYGRKLETTEGRWELLRCFLTNTINGKPTDEFRYQTMFEWLVEYPSPKLEGNNLKYDIHKFWYPLIQGKIYEFQVDWAIPYIATHPYAYSSTLGVTRDSARGADYFFPFQNFIGNFPDRDVVTITKAHRNYPLKLTPTGYGLFYIAGHILAQIEYLNQKNTQALKNYYIYQSRLALVKQSLLSRGTFKASEPGPFQELSQGEIDVYIEESQKNYPQARWEKEMVKGPIKWLTDGDVIDSEIDLEKNLRQLALAIADIEKLHAFFRSVTVHESQSMSSSSDIGRRNQAIAILLDSLLRLRLCKTWKNRFAGLWRWNTDPYGTILYVAKIDGLLGQSKHAGEMYARVYEHELIENIPENQAAGREAAKQAQEDPDHLFRFGSWIWQFKKAAADIFVHYYKTHVQKIADQMTPTHKTVLTKTIKNYRKFNIWLFDLEAGQFKKLEEITTREWQIEIKKIPLDRKTREERVDQFQKRIIKKWKQSLDASGKKKLARALKMRGAVLGLNMFLFGMSLDKILETEMGLSERLHILTLVDDALLFADVLGDVTGLRFLQRMKPLINRFHIEVLIIGAVCSAYDVFEDLTGDGARTANEAVVNSTILAGTLASVAGDLILGGTITAPSGVGIVLLAGGVITLIAASVVGAFSLWEYWQPKTRTFCQKLQTQGGAEGGMDCFSAYKIDFEYGADFTYRGFSYDTATFGLPADVDRLIDRVEVFLEDGDSYDAYGTSGISIIPRSLQIPLRPGNGGRTIGTLSLHDADIIMATGTWDIPGFAATGSLEICCALLYIGNGEVLDIAENKIVTKALSQIIDNASSVVALRYPRLLEITKLNLVRFAKHKIGTEYGIERLMLQKELFRVDFAIWHATGERVAKMSQNWVGKIDFGIPNNGRFLYSTLLIKAYGIHGCLLKTIPRISKKTHTARLISTIDYVGHLKAKSEQV